MLLTIASLIIVLGVLVSVHEFGHFIVAKAVGIQVRRFSLGFGRPLIAWRRGETEYWISWIPLGGYVKMAGLEEEGMAGELEGGKAAVPIDPERAFDKKPLWARMAVILAGVTMNVLLAFAIYTSLGLAVGNPTRPTTQVDTVLASRVPPEAAALATLQRGDRILAINGDSVRNWEDVQTHLLLDTGAVRLDVTGRGTIRIKLPRDDNARLGLALWGIEPLMPARIGRVVRGEPARRAGLKHGDLVVRAGGASRARDVPTFPRLLFDQPSGAEPAADSGAGWRACDVPHRRGNSPPAALAAAAVAPHAAGDACGSRNHGGGPEQRCPPPLPLRV